MADEPIDPPQEAEAPADDAAKIKELRNTNIEVLKERDSLQATVEQMQQQLADLSAAADAGQRAAEEKQTLAQRIEALETANRTATEALEAEKAKGRESMLRDTLTQAFAERNGGDARAAADAAALAVGEWEVGTDGQLTHKTQPYNADTGQAVTPGEYAAQFLLDRPHFAGRSTGDGRQGLDGRDAQGRRVVDPTDPVALGQYADEIASGEAVLGEST